MFDNKNVLIAAGAGLVGGGLLIWGVTKLASKYAAKTQFPDLAVKAMTELAKKRAADKAKETANLEEQTVATLGAVLKDLEMPVQAVFAHNWKNGTQVAYDPEWANGTGYFDGAVDIDFTPIHHPGTILSFMDQHGRAALIVVGSKSLGNAVFFQRFNDDNGRQLIRQVSNNIRRALDIRTAAPWYTDDEFYKIFGLLSTTI